MSHKECEGRAPGWPPWQGVSSRDRVHHALSEALAAVHAGGAAAQGHGPQHSWGGCSPLARILQPCGGDVHAPPFVHF